MGYALIIDSIEKTILDEFLITINSILLSYGFVTGSLPRNVRYILSSDKGCFSEISGILFETLQNSLTSTLSVFPSSTYRKYFNLPHNIAFPQHIFNKLCEVSKQHNEFSRVLFLLIEGHTLSTELQASIYSIALEAITNIISEENGNRLMPICNKKLSKNVINDLKEVLNKYNNTLAEEGMKTLINKINSINSPTNKQKLTRPFEIYGIELNPREIEAINKRNDFLHGRIPLSISSEDDKFYLQQIAYTILYCVTVLILKYVGYSGFVMYYPTLNELSKSKTINDFLIKNI